MSVCEAERNWVNCGKRRTPVDGSHWDAGATGYLELWLCRKRRSV